MKEKRTRYYLDTEFIERGRQHPIELISIGIVCEDNREFYTVSSEFNPDHASQWVKDNVIAKLGDINGFCSPVAQIAQEVRTFCDPDKYGKQEFWGYYSDYDWVVFCQMFGSMIDLPKGWPMYCNDIKQLAMDLGNPQLPEQGKGEHNALADARWNRIAHQFLIEKANPIYYLHPGAWACGAVIVYAPSTMKTWQLPQYLLAMSLGL
jgi:hypothetical protein